MIRIGIVEDHKMFRQALRVLFGQVKGMEIVLEAECGAEYEKMYDPSKVDITLMDFRLKGQNGVATTLNITRKFPQARVIMLSMYDDFELILGAIRYGACAYITKDSGLEYITHTIKMVNEYQYYFDKNLGEMMIAEMNKVHRKKFVDNEFRIEFSDQEIRVAMLSCSGLTNDQIAQEMGVSRRNVENHRTNMQEKTDCASFQGVIIYMFKNFFLSPYQF